MESKGKKEKWKKGISQARGERAGAAENGGRGEAEECKLSG